MLEENPSVIEQIYDILRQNAPDYDVQKIYQLLLKKNIHHGCLEIFIFIPMHLMGSMIFQH